jgi:acetylornithine deacetylase
MNVHTTEQILAHLVSYDTTSRDSNLALLDWIEAWLAQYGIQGERVYNETGSKANFFATIGPQDRGGYVLSGHTDTVPVEGQDWQTHPFQLVAQGDRLHGRGTTDMKGFIACALSRVPAMTASELQTPIHLAFSYDEEVGCQGVPKLLAELAQRPVKPLGCFVGEPTEMAIVVAQKAKQSFRVQFRGVSCHSSQAPLGVNAILYAARFVHFMESLNQRLASGAAEALYDIPVSTAHVGVIQGGTAINIVPQDCVVELEFRVLPTEDMEAIVTEMKQAVAALDVEMKARDATCYAQVDAISAFPGLHTSPQADIVTLAHQLRQTDAISKVAFGTEAGLFSQLLGVPTVVVGPGSIDQAHKPNEFVRLDQLRACETFLDRLVQHCRQAQAVTA